MYTTEGTLVAWLSPSGSHVGAGQPVLAIETEKATHEVPAPASGILHAVIEVGALLKEQTVVGYILAPGEAPPEVFAVESSGLIKASPIARRLAVERGIDLASVRGTGPGGRIGEADVRAAVERISAREPATAPGVAPRWRIRERAPFSPMRRTIAQRLRRSLNTAIALTLTREAEADRLVTARERLSATLGAPVPFDALFVKFLAVGLRECPTLNAVVHEDELLLLDEVNIGLAVSVPRGLIVPVIRDADTASLGAISRQVRDLAERSRAGTIKPIDLEGGTATVTNLGDHGIDAFTPVLNPPQSTVLGVGCIRPRAVVRSGAIVAAHTCTLSLTFDHRVEDGASAARLLAVIADLMNDDGVLDGFA